MRTTLDLPEELINEAQEVSGARTKTLTVCLALQEFIQAKKMRRLADYRGKIHLDIDVEKSRDEWDEK